MSESRSQCDDANFEIGAPLQRLSLSQAIASRLQQLIEKQKLKNGSRLPSERELCIALGVGRSAVREGLRILEGSGVVAIRHGKGIFVLDGQVQAGPDLSHLDSSARTFRLRQAIQARRCIEVEIAAAAAKAATSADLSQLQRFLGETEQRGIPAGSDYKPDLGFEHLLGQATHNQYLIAVQKVVHRMFIATVMSVGAKQHPKVRNNHFKKILVAVQFGNSDRAAEQMLEYFHHLSE